MSMVENQKMMQEKGMDEFLKSQAEKYDAQTVAMSFRCMTENAMHAVFKQKNRKVPILSSGGYPTENRVVALRYLYLFCILKRPQSF